MSTMNDALADLVRRDLVSIIEAKKVSPDAQSLVKAIHGNF